MSNRWRWPENWIPAFAGMAFSVLALISCSGGGGREEGSTSTPPPGETEDAITLSRTPIAEDSSWTRYVLDQDRVDGYVLPKRITVEGAGGTVEKPEALTRACGTEVTTVTAAGPGLPQLVIDLGINTGGFVEIEFTAATPTLVRLGYSEARRFLTPEGDMMLDSLGADDDLPQVVPGLPNQKLTPRLDDILLTGPQKFVSPVPRGAIRWISLQPQTPGVVSFKCLRVLPTQRHAPLADYTGHFLSSDDQLNRIWYAAAYSFSFLTLRDLRESKQFDDVPVSLRWVYVDGQKRDRWNWVDADSLTAYLGLHSLRWGSEVTRNSIHQFSCQQRADGLLQMASEIAVVCPDEPPPAGMLPARGGENPHVLLTNSRLPEWSMQWVSLAEDYYLYTGDAGLIRTLMPVIRRVQAYCLVNSPNGLFTLPPPQLAPLNWHPFDRASGTDTHTNAAYFRMLRDIARLEREIMQDEEKALAAEARAEVVRAALIEAHWDEAAGAFILNSESPFVNHTQDAQVATVAYGLINGVMAESAMRFVDEHLETPYGPMNGEIDHDPYMSNYISPYISGVQLLMHFARGETENAYSLMRRMWGHMVDTDPHSTFWEKLAPDGDTASYTPNQIGNDILPSNFATNRGLPTLGHSWSGAAGPALSMYTLGIRPVAAGFSEWIVAPQPGDLRWAQGQVPTPLGVIVSRWQRGEADGSFVLTVSAPATTRGTVIVPELGAPRRIAMDGRIVWKEGSPAAGVVAERKNGAVHFSGVTGAHTFAWGHN